MAFEQEEMVVAGDNDVSLGEQGTFQDPVVRFILQNVEVRPRLEHRCDLPNGPQGALDLFV